ncbi:MAG TPA: hypothetical protein VN808_03550 [Stellaceae bacterium]|nr:hypothetical protein [Stellaceae bacterium]
MAASTLPHLAVLTLLALAACSTTDTAATDTASPDPGGWLMSSGKEPTGAEFTALSATCEAKGGAVDPCLTDLGLKRTK